MGFENTENTEIVSELEDLDTDDISDDSYDPDRRIDSSNNQFESGTNLFDPDQRICIPDDNVELSENYTNDDISAESNTEYEAIAPDVDITDDVPIIDDSQVIDDLTNMDSGIIDEQNDSAENNEFRINQEAEISELYKDDNGKIYRDANSLLPGIEIVKNGYTYKTDDLGRVTSAEGQLQAKNHEGYNKISDSMEKVGKGDQEKDDQRGHLIADRFNGSGDIANLVPMNGELNQGDYASMENKLSDAVNVGADVYYKVEPVYVGDSHRPSEFRVSYSIDGEKDIVVFKNEVNSK